MRIILFGLPVHSGLKTASVVRVMAYEGPRLKTPFEGKVKGVQCCFVVVAVGRAILIICLTSIAITSRPAASLGQLFSGDASISYFT